VAPPNEKPFCFEGLFLLKCLNDDAGQYSSKTPVIGPGSEQLLLFPVCFTIP
jgi:hypothetical protein